MDLEAELFDSGNSTNRNTLLRKCKDTIQTLEEDIENHRKVKMHLEKRLRDSASMQNNLRDEIDDKNFKLKTISIENSELISSMEALAKRIVSLEQENENSVKEIEAFKSKLNKSEIEISHMNAFMNEMQNELNTKNDMIKEWNSAMTAVEHKMESLEEENTSLKKENETCFNKYTDIMKENKEFNYLWNEQRRKIDNISQELVNANYENENLLKNISLLKDSLSFKEFDLENKTKQLKELLESSEENGNNIKTLENMNSKLNSKLKFSREEINSYKIKSEGLEKILKEEATRHQREIDNLNITFDQKISLHQKEDIKKEQIIADLENELKAFRDDLDYLVSSDTLLQNRYKDILCRYSAKKILLTDCSSDNIKLSTALNRFEDRLKLIETASIKDVNILKNEKEFLNGHFLEQMELKDREHSRRLEEIQSKNEAEILKYRTELIKLKEDLMYSLHSKEEEIAILNGDRNKLQIALSELENKVIEISRNLENSVGDCWKLSNQINRENEIRRNEIEKLNGFYKEKLLLKDDEMRMQHERSNERTKDKYMNTHERLLMFKGSMRSELESLRYICENIQSDMKTEVLNAIQKIQLLITSFNP